MKSEHKDTLDNMKQKILNEQEKLALSQDELKERELSHERRSQLMKDERNAIAAKLKTSEAKTLTLENNLKRLIKKVTDLIYFTYMITSNDLVTSSYFSSSALLLIVLVSK